MALRATNGPTPSAKSLKVGAKLTVTAKVENTVAAAEPVALHVIDLKEGALGKPVEFAFSFDPPSVEVPGKSRKVVSFSWTAGLPADKTAFTFRGKLALRHALTGQLVGEAPLDLYVSF